VLRDRGLHAKKHFGQNFLHDPSVVESIAKATVPKLGTDSGGKGGSVVEIGAGLGALTGALLGRAEYVVAIERDRDLVPILAEEFAPAVATGQLLIEEADAKTADFLAALEGHPRPWAISGNLPYQLTGPLLRKLCGIARSIDRAVTMVQSEVADRMVSAPGSGNYGTLSVFLQAAFKVERVRKVGRGAFHPSPRVDSTVVRLTPHPAGTGSLAETPGFRAAVRGGFSQRRKKLRSSWKGALGLDRDSIIAAAEAAGINLDARAEELSVADFQRMGNELDARTKHGKPSADSTSEEEEP
jgi:16S rRNA (adenine1518-N6/adenine1519-N6)-dimethyltransferase